MTAPGRVTRLRGLAALISVVAVVTAGCTPPAPASGDLDAFVRANGFDALPRAVVQLGGSEATGPTLTVAAVVADTPEAQARGLMGVELVPDGVGMLFVFPGTPGPGGRPGFWMRDTLVPLDIAFAADGVVVGVATMVPCPCPPCPITHPGVEYDVALEVGAGVLGAAGIGPGDRLVREVG